MIRSFVLLMLLSFLLPAEADPQQPARLALLIGNQNYTPKVGELKNPLRDIELIGRALEKLGFKVTMLADAGKAQMDEAFRRYVDRVRNAGPNAIGFFYYSGHGVLNPDTNVNYLIPTDLDDAETDNVWYRSIEQQALIDLLSQRAHNATHFVVFDACRNELNLSGEAGKALGAEKGFVPVNNVSGILIAYATAQKKTAADTGMFARILAEELVKPGVEAFSVFREVQVRVKDTMHQEPWMSLNYIPRIYLAAAPGVVEPATHSPRRELQPPLSEAAQEWALIDKSNAVDLQTFLSRHGDSLQAAYAKARLAAIERAEGERNEASKPGAKQSKNDAGSAIDPAKQAAKERPADEKDQTDSNKLSFETLSRKYGTLAKDGSEWYIRRGVSAIGGHYRQLGVSYYDMKIRRWQKKDPISLEACKQACLDDSLCRAFVFASSICQLHSSQDLETVTASAGLVAFKR